MKRHSDALTQLHLYPFSHPSRHCATATTCVALAGEKREQRQYKILRVVYTNSNTVANKRQPGPVKGRGNECTLMPLLCCPPFPSLSPSATVFCSVSFAIFILLQNVFVSTLLYLFCAHTKKVVCSPFNRPPPPPQPSFLHSLPCLATGNPSQMLPSTAAVPLFVAALSPLLSIRCCLYFLLLCLYACVCA